MTRVGCSVLLSFLLAAGAAAIAGAGEPSPGVADKPASSCAANGTSICTIEIWLAFAKKEKNAEVVDFLKSKSIKVIRNTIQYLKPTGGHPPTNIAIGSGITAGDARLALDLAIKYNDRIDGLIMQRLNPPNYVAIGTSAWDEKSEIRVTPENVERLRDPALTTEKFHRLYKDLTNEDNRQAAFY